MANGNNSNGAPKPVRCAIYTRKSTDEGLNQDFNSLDAQRDAGESYIRSQAGEGWTLLPDQYDDGGYTGANMDRPALRRLLADIQAKKVDCVVVYKVDRLSREIKRRTRVVGLFPNEASLLRLVSAVLMEISEEWETSKLYLRMEDSSLSEAEEE
jgi:DNA invertase Pin-like site-specific DNA recombinase